MFFGPALVAAEATMVANRIVNASPRDRIRVGVVEGSGLVGGLLGGSVGAILGVGLLASNPAGWVILGASLTGGMVGGTIGGSAFREASEFGFRQYDQINYSFRGSK